MVLYASTWKLEFVYNLVHDTMSIHDGLSVLKDISKAEFSLVKIAMSHDPSIIIVKYWFSTQIAFLINVENS